MRPLWHTDGRRVWCDTAGTLWLPDREGVLRFDPADDTLVNGQVMLSLGQQVSPKRWRSRRMAASGSVH
ncbi:MAG: hypothetical protein IPH50_10655 [Rhodanobacteraceae bacterium]|nr:hypothetical protein [Rhodanobacteraceae bacterium]